MKPPSTTTEALLAIAWGDQTDKFDQPYDFQDDLAKSVAEGFRAIRERKATGGPGWTAGGDAEGR